MNIECVTTMKLNEIAIKHCLTHGPRTFSQLSIKRHSKGRVQYICTECNRRNSREGQVKWRQKYREKVVAGLITDFQKKQRREKMNKANLLWQNKQSEQLTDYYIRKILKEKGFKEDQMTPEILEIKKASLSIKRIVKERKEDEANRRPIPSDDSPFLRWVCNCEGLGHKLRSDFKA
jgi:hypothetical protein